MINEKEKLVEQLKAFKDVQYELKYNNEGMNIETVDHYYKWISNIIQKIEFEIKKEEEFDFIKIKMMKEDNDLVFPFVERTE
tara:strand:- start:949 stop:1194 length:246 start_codon:yes stop_codon:yes gene_type:complete